MKDSRNEMSMSVYNVSLSEKRVKREGMRLRRGRTLLVLHLR